MFVFDDVAVDADADAEDDIFMLVLVDTSIECSNNDEN